MELTDKQKVAQELLAKTLSEVWENETFKIQLIESPLEAIENLTKQKFSLKDEVEMVVTDQSNPKVFYFNIPPKPIIEDIELSDHQLDIVAGGGSGDLLQKAKNAIRLAKLVWDLL